MQFFLKSWSYNGVNIQQRLYSVSSRLFKRRVCGFLLEKFLKLTSILSEFFFANLDIVRDAICKNLTKLDRHMSAPYRSVLDMLLTKLSIFYHILSAKNTPKMRLRLGNHFNTNWKHKTFHF